MSIVDEIIAQWNANNARAWEKGKAVWERQPAPGRVQQTPQVQTSAPITGTPLGGRTFLEEVEAQLRANASRSNAGTMTKAEAASRLAQVAEQTDINAKREMREEVREQLQANADAQKWRPMSTTQPNTASTRRMQEEIRAQLQAEPSQEEKAAVRAQIGQEFADQQANRFTSGRGAGSSPAGSLNALGVTPERATQLKQEEVAAARTARPVEEVEREIAEVQQQLRQGRDAWQVGGIGFGSILGPLGKATEDVVRFFKNTSGSENVELETRMEELRKELQNSYAALKYNAPDFKEKSKYQSTKEGGANFGFGDVTYEMINNYARASAEDKVKLADQPWGHSPLDNMSSNQVEIYNYLYATKGKSAAEGYIELIMPELNKIEMDRKENDMEALAEENPVLASLVSVGVSPVKGIGYIGQMIDYADKGYVDPNAPYTLYSHVSSSLRSGVRKQVEESWGPVGSFLYDTGMSMGDFLMNTGITGGNEAATLAIMGTGAASDAVIEARERGLTSGQSFALGTIAGAAEVVTEKLSLDMLLDTAKIGKNALLYVLKNALVEGSEEGASDLVNLVADILISKDKSEWQKSINQYKDQGYDDGGAFWRALLDQGAKTGLSILGGSISGGSLAGGSVTINDFITAFNLWGSYSSETEATKSGLIESGLERREGTAARTHAERMQEKGDMNLLQAARQLQYNEYAIAEEEEIARYEQAAKEGRRFEDVYEEEKRGGLLRKKEARKVFDAALQAEGEQAGAQTETDQTGPEQGEKEQGGQDQAGPEQDEQQAGPQSVETVAQPAAPQQTEEQKSALQELTEQESPESAREIERESRVATEQPAVAGRAEVQQVEQKEVPQRTGNALQDLIEQENRNDEPETARTEEGATENEVLPDDDQRRVYREGSGGQAGELAESARGTWKRTAQQVRTAIERQNRISDLRLPKVSSRELGLQTGTDEKRLTVIPQESWDDAMRKNAERLAAEDLQVTYVLGGIRAKKASGGIAYINGARLQAVAGEGQILIQADDLQLSVGEIGSHELYHDKAFLTPGLVRSTEEKIRQQFDEAEFDAIVQTYVENLRGVYDADVNEDEAYYRIVEEILADAYAGINRFGTNASQYQEAVREETEQGRQSGVETERETGPPAEAREESEEEAEGEKREQENPLRELVEGPRETETAEESVQQEERTIPSENQEEEREESPEEGQATASQGEQPDTSHRYSVSETVSEGIGETELELLKEMMFRLERLVGEDSVSETMGTYLLNMKDVYDHSRESYYRVFRQLLTDAVEGVNRFGARADQYRAMLIDNQRIPGWQKWLEQKGLGRFAEVREEKLADKGKRDTQFEDSGAVDDKGRELSKGQQEFFNDSVVRDAQNNLMTMYHGTNADKAFTTFNTYGSKYGLFGVGSYFTNDREIAEKYTKKGKGKNPRVYEVYLNIKNPIDMDGPYDERKWDTAWARETGVWSFLRGDPNIKTNEDAFRKVEEFCEIEEMLSYEGQEFMYDLIETMGYDGITHIGGGRHGNKDGPRHTVYIAMEPEQIKAIGNKAPTENGDIRYSVSDSTERVRENRKSFEELRRRGAELSSDKEEIKRVRKEEQKVWDAEKRLGTMTKRQKGFALALARDFMQEGDIPEDIRQDPRVDELAKVYRQAIENGYYPEQHTDEHWMRMFDREDQDEELRRRERELLEEQQERWHPEVMEPKEPEWKRKGFATEEAWVEDRMQRIAAAKGDDRKETFRGSDALEELGVKIEGNVGNYSEGAQIEEDLKEQRKLDREIKRAERKLGATTREKTLALELANGIVTQETLPNDLGMKELMTINELASLHAYRRALGTNQAQQVRFRIQQKVDEKIQTLFDDIATNPEYNPMPGGGIAKILMNERNPERVTKSIFGAEKGQQIWKELFYPVEVNASEKYRFTNRMLDQVREFEDQQGKKRKLSEKEDALVQKVKEGRAIDEQVEESRHAEAIKAMADDLRRTDEFRTLEATKSRQKERNRASEAVMLWITNDERGSGLSAKEKGLVRHYARWLNTQDEMQGEDLTIINNAVKVYDELYNKMYDAINDFLTAHGYEPIGFIKGYSPHMQSETVQNNLLKALQSVGVNTEVVSTLPANIAGLTADFKPNMRYNPYFQTRYGDFTEYSITRGFESYLTYISDVLYHTDDVMRIRRAVNHLRSSFSSDQTRENISQLQGLRAKSRDDKIFALYQTKPDIGWSGMTAGAIDEQLDKLIQEQYDSIVNNSRYSEFVTWLDNYANTLAGKQSLADRGREYTAGRHVLNFSNKLMRRFGDVNVAGNVSSMLNQTAQLPLITNHIGMKYTMRAIKDIASGEVKKAGFLDRSDFLTGKKGIDWISGTKSDQIIEAMYWGADRMDKLVSAIAVRGEYLRLLDQGMEEKEALREADLFGRRVMGSRMKGVRPAAYENKRLFSQMVHKFQLEVTNTFDYMFMSDLPQEIKQTYLTEGKAAAIGKVASMALRYLIAAFLMNRFADELYGGTPVPYDLIGMAGAFVAGGLGQTLSDWIPQIIDNATEDLFGERVFGSKRVDPQGFDLKKAWEATSYTFTNDIPLLSNALGVMGWGDQSTPMLGINEAYDALGKAWEAAWGDEDTEPDLLDAGENVMMALTGLVPGGRQIRKTLQGTEDLVRGGRYRGHGDDAKLLYPIDGDPGDYLATLFGRNAFDETERYYTSGAKELSVRQTQVYDELTKQGASRTEVYDAIMDWRRIDKDKDLSSFGKTAQKLDAIRETSMNDEQKMRLYETLSDAPARAEKARELMGQGLSFDEVAGIIEKYQELNLDDEMKASKKARELSKWADIRFPEQAEEIKDLFQYFTSVPASAGVYDKMTGAGLDIDTASRLADTLEAIEPEEGKETVSEQQKFDAIIRTVSSTGDQLTALSAVADEGEGKKIRVAYDYDVLPGDYVRAKAAIAKFNDNGSISNAEAKAGLDTLGISQAKKAVLWQVFANGAPKNNPYSPEVGERVKNSM